MMKKLPGQVQSHIKEKTTNYAKHINKGKKMVRFESGDLVLIHLSKGIFLTNQNSKLMPRVDRPFWAIKSVNDNAQKVHLLGEYNVSATFNVKDLSPYLEDADESDLRKNHF